MTQQPHEHPATTAYPATEYRVIILSPPDDDGSQRIKNSTGWGSLSFVERCTRRLTSHYGSHPAWRVQERETIRATPHDVRVRLCADDAVLVLHTRDIKRARREAIAALIVEHGTDDPRCALVRGDPTRAGLYAPGTCDCGQGCEAYEATADPDAPDAAWGVFWGDHAPPTQ